MRPARVVLLLAAIAAPCSAQGRDEASFGLAVTRLELRLDLDYEDGSLRGTATYTIANRSDRPVSTVPFNLGRLMTVRAARIVGGPALDLAQDIAVFADDPRRQVDHMEASLPEPLAAGSEVRLSLDYGGFLVGYTETGSVYIQDRVVWNDLIRYRKDGDFSILRTDAFAWPVPGTLRIAANRTAPRLDFAFRAEVTVPEPYVVAGAGRLASRTTADGRTTFVYESVLPVPFLNLPIARYGLLEGSGAKVYHFPDDSSGARRVLESTERGLALLSSWFGPLDSPPDVVIMEIPEMWGSQANLAAGIIQTADAFGSAATMTPVYHELSHLWNARDVDLPSARWNEGLATFLQFRMAEELDGESLQEGVARVVDRIVATAPETYADVPFERYGKAGSTDLSYRVGCLMFYALYSRMGPAAFDRAMGEFFQGHADTGWTFDELVEHFQASSQADLSGFFDVWVYTTAWYDRLRSGTPPEAIGLAPPSPTSGSRPGEAG